MSSILDVNTLYQNLLNLSLSEEEQEATTGALLLSRRHSACSSDLPCSSSSSSSNSGDPSPVWPLRSHWTPSGQQQQQPRPVGELGRRPPLRPDRSVSLIEGKALPPPPPGFPPLRLPPLATASTPSRYKTELCRTFSETGRCKYGSKCQFAHGPTELRSVNRHPKYKTELCHKFYLYGECPYGTRCHFVHHLDEAQGYRRSSSSSPQLLRQSISYSGVPTAHRSSPPLPSIPDPASFARAASVSPPPISASDLLSPTFGHLNSDPLAFLSALGDSLPSTPISAGCCSCRCGKKTSLTSPFQTQHEYFPAAPEMPTSATGSTLPRTPSASSLSDPDCYSSDSSLSGSDSPVFEMQASSGTAGSPHRLPIFNRLSVSE